MNNLALWADFDLQNLLMRGVGSPDSIVDWGRLMPKKPEAKSAEEARIEELFDYEKALWQQGITYIAGTDEVGRGPIAGPVVAAAVILPSDFVLYGVNDSKKLSESKRLLLEKIIKAKAVAWAIAAIGPQIIDQINILEASKMAMVKAIRLLPVEPQHLLIDAVKLDLPIAQTSIIKGDAKSASIGAASILAKCHRDRMMAVYDQLYPEYGLAGHAGYPTPSHKQAVFDFGYSKIHRKSFVLKPIKQKAKTNKESIKWEKLVQKTVKQAKT